WIAIKVEPLRDEVEAHKNWVDPAKCKYLVANLFAEFGRHETYVKVAHERDSAVGGRDAHALPVDANEHFADFVEGCRIHHDNWHRVVQQTVPAVSYFLQEPLGLTRHPALPVSSQDVVDWDELPIDWLAVDNPVRVIVVSVRNHYKTEAT